MKLVIVPSEKISDYEAKGLTNMKEYYNPGAYFTEVFLVSPLENSKSYMYGMNIVPVKDGKDFKAAIECIKPDVIRAYGGYWASTFAIRNRPKNIPVVVSVHDTDPILLNSIVKFADSVICMTPAVGKAVKNIGCSDSKIVILPNRIDTSRFNTNVKKSNHLDLPSAYILHIGRRTEQKNLETLISALPNIPRDIHLITIGMGNTSQYAKLADSFGVSERITFLDKVDNNTLPTYYKNAIAFVLPSRWEGFGIVFIEALACGCPVITSDIAPMNEMLKNNFDSILISPNSKDELSKSLNELVGDDQLRNTLIRNGLETSKRYERGKVDLLEIDIYKNAIAGHVAEKKSILLYFSIYRDSLYLLKRKVVRKIMFLLKNRKWS